jgi:UDPglucose 6-dehydrogenase
MKVKIIGNGWVGRSMHRMFPDAVIETHKKKETCDIAFICVPTPLKDGTLDTSIVEQVVRDCDEPLIVIRSTVMPGTCDRLQEIAYDQPICFVPEYLGETPDHPMTDQKKFLIIGGKPEDRREVIKLYQTVYNANVKIRQVTNYEAEVIKLSENRAIAFKIADCQELYDACEAAGVDYYTIRDAVYGDDPRFNLWWTFIYEKRGFQSKCLPKDVYGWATWAESIGYDPEITRKILERNKKWVK